MPAHPPSNRDLLAVVRAWVAVNYPGYPLEYLSIRLRFLPAAIRLVEAPAIASPPRKETKEEEQEEEQEEIFVPDPFQEAILSCLEGKAMRTDALGNAVGDRRRLFRKPRGGLAELREQGLVKNHSRLGFYRTDAPPPELAEE